MITKEKLTFQIYVKIAMIFSRVLFMKKFILIIFLLFVFCLIDMYCIEPKMLLVKKEKIYLKNWEEKADGLKIAIISDLHIGTYHVNTKKVKQIVNKVNSQNPDFIFLLGDLDAKAISTSKTSISEISDILSGLNSKYGTYTIFGNHDYYPQNIVKNIFLKANIPVLENNSQTVNYKGTKIKITGLKDLWYFGYKSDVINRNNEKCLIVLSHNPDAFPQIPKYVSLTLCGHTHGGEIYLPIIGSPFVPSDFGQRYRKGLIIENGKILYVSGGIASLSRFRFLNPPEISV